MKVITLSSTFPNPLQKDLGMFIRSRLRALAVCADVKVIAPVAYVEYGNPARRSLKIQRIAAHAAEESLDIFYPRWWYLPNAGPITAFLLAFQMWRPFARLIRSFSFDLIDSHFAFPDGIAAALLARWFDRPYSVTLRGNETDHDHYFFRARAMRWAIRQADCVIAVSERLRTFAIECGAEPTRVKTIPNGIDGTLYHRRSGRGVLEQYGLPVDVPLILSAGYLIERKGHHRVIEALQTLAETGCTAHLVIAGGPGAEGVFEPTLRKKVSEFRLSDRVHFLGPVPANDLAGLMSACTLFVLASSNEGWPNVLNEAMACGLPVVATDVGAAPEIIPSTDYGLIVPLGDKDALADAISAGLSRSWDRAKIERRGASRSWKHVAQEVAGAFEETISTRKVH